MAHSSSAGKHSLFLSFFRTCNSFVLVLDSLPAEVTRRVNALRNLQFEHHKIEASFFEEVHALECRYLTQYKSLYDKVGSTASRRNDR